MLYLVTYDGDIEGEKDTTKPWIAENRVFASLPDALEAISQDFPIEWDFFYKRHRRLTPDPEDDRIVTWELNPGEKMKPVWTYCGWHWSCGELGLSQGTLPGDGKTLYEIATEDM